MVLGLIGSTIEPTELITGVRLVDKLHGAKANNTLRLELWYTHTEAQRALEALRISAEMCLRRKLDGTLRPQPPKPQSKLHVMDDHPPQDKQEKKQPPARPWHKDSTPTSWRPGGDSSQAAHAPASGLGASAVQDSTPTSWRPGGDTSQAG
jgi:hypothetical protein